MSIDYYAVPVRDPKSIGGIVEGTNKSATKIDEAAIGKALAKLGMLTMAPKSTARWERGRDYVFVNVLPTHVLVTHNASTSEQQMNVLIEVLDALSRTGLHVWDPQQGSWFP